ncbi:MAG: gliding motility lipoprotein GldD [Flavobacteriales bacterium]|nr:gliding motility lipoprotein GldD [Flavobacteriales bacterium]
MLLLLLVACGPDHVPKPRGYFRIDLPSKAYVKWSPECPLEAEVSQNAKPLLRSDSSSCWMDIRYPSHRATVHLTYKPVAGDLPRLIEDAHGFKNKHQVKASRVRSERIMREHDRVYGTLFDVEGDVASPFVFYLTDSARHFLYGSLYFDARPNADSLAPVTDRIREDMRHLAGTLKWR